MDQNKSINNLNRIVKKQINNLVFKAQAFINLTNKYQHLDKEQNVDTIMCSAQTIRHITCKRILSFDIIYQPDHIIICIGINLTAYTHKNIKIYIKSTQQH